MNEHLEFLAASTMMGNLMHRRAIIIQTLQKPQHKGDIMLTGELTRIQNDINELDKVMTSTGLNILAGFTARYNCQFKYLLMKPKISTEG
ncbi:MAG TPA: hypothetical protein VK508_01840 [Cyclobacteriaceae bacterium]|nr:hypothetical protein [Cyclobacteriaceae bacterium]